MPTKKATAQPAATKKSSTKKGQASRKVSITTVEAKPATLAASKPEPSVTSKPAEHKKTTETPVTPKSVTDKRAVTKPSTKKAETSVAVRSAAESKTTATSARPESTSAKQTGAKKKAAKPAVTTMIAKVDVGYGNDLYIRGEGAGLSWDSGILMENTGSNEWRWATESTSQVITFKFLINDQNWSIGDNLTVTPGDTSISTPTFS